MKVLRELVRYVCQEDISIDFLTVQEKRLLRGIANGRFRSAEDATKTLYGEAGNYSTFRNVAASLRKKLIHVIAGKEIQQPEYSSYFEAKAYCYQYHRRAQMLLDLELKRSAVSLFHQVLDRAREFEITDIRYACARSLALVYSYRGRKEDYVQAQEEMLCAEQSVQAEMRAQALSNHVTYLATSGNLTDDKINIIREHVHQLNTLKEKHPTRSNCLDYYRAYLILLQADKNPSQVIAGCDEAIMFLQENQKFRQKKLLLEFLTTKAHAYMLLGDKLNAQFTYINCIRHVRVHSHHFYEFATVAFILSMHLEQYTDAHHLLTTVLNRTKLREQPAAELERWRLLEAYYRFWRNRNEPTCPKNEIRYIESVWRLSPMSRADRKGWNTALVVVQALYYLRWGDLDGLEERFDALKRYTVSRMTEVKERRTQLFLRLLILVAKYSGDAATIERRAKVYLDKMKACDTSDEYEIIPFEQLWEWIAEAVTQQDARSESWHTLGHRQTAYL